MTSISANEQQFLLECLKNGAREDGRQLDEFRGLEVSLGNQPGYADVRLGKTRVAARVSGRITKPYEDRPFDGLFDISTEIGPIAGASFENGRLSDNEVLVSRLIEKAVKRSQALDLESLCIISGEKCWNITVNVHFLDFDGGFIDASCIAVLAALQHYKRPDVTVQNGEVVVHSVEEREPVKLAILHVPICVTFWFFNQASTEDVYKGEAKILAVVDATAKEESLAQGSLTITINKNKEVCQISKPGGLNVDAAVLLDCAGRAAKIAEKISNRLKSLE